MKPTTKNYMENEGISLSKHANIKSSINRSVYCCSTNRIILGQVISSLLFWLFLKCTSNVSDRIFVFFPQDRSFSVSAPAIQSQWFSRTMGRLWLTKPTSCVCLQTQSSCCCTKKRCGLQCAGVSAPNTWETFHQVSLADLILFFRFWPVDGGTAWMARDSLRIETDVVDFSGGADAPWWFLAQQLKHDLASIILMSEEDLQVQEKIWNFNCLCYLCRWNLWVSVNVRKYWYGLRL